MWANARHTLVNRSKSNRPTSDLVKLLQKSGVEHMTEFRQSVARDFCRCVVATVTTDFEAMYAFKYGDYKRCLQLSEQNVHTLLCVRRYWPHAVLVLPVFFQLMDDDIVSVTALSLLIDPDCRQHGYYAEITQLTLSLYLMTQCQLKLLHSVTSLAEIFDYIKIAQRKHSGDPFFLDQLTLKLIYRIVVAHLNALL